jgi:tripartite-type tricarboxylate transporter receptor subunit TctC
MKSLSRVAAACLASLLIFSSGSVARADDPVSFEGKTLTMLIGYAAGGGTDLFGRILAPYLAENLPGKPVIVIRNMPGADGVVALNAFVQQTAPDGLTFTVGSGTQVDPFTYRIAKAQYDLTKFRHIGGAGRTGTVMMIDAKALPRLLDKSQPPVVMGALSAVRSGMMMTLWGGEYLGWNVKWVTGYKGANDLLLALSRHEIDMTSAALMDQVDGVRQSGDFRVVTQSGMLQNGALVPRPEFPDVPVLGNQIEPMITDTVARKAFAHWKTIMLVGQWVALPPETPKPIVDAYIKAFHAAFQNPTFRERSKKVDPGMMEMSGEDMLSMVTMLGQTPPEALSYLESIARKQGLPGLQ